MDERLEQLKTKWFGLKKSDVQREIRRLKRLQEAELDSLKKRRDEMQKEHARLTEQRGQLVSRRSELVLHDKLQRLALDRLPDAVDVLQQFAEEEKNALLAHRNHIDRACEQKAARMEQKARRYREIARNLLQELASLLAQVRAEGWKDMDESAAVGKKGFAEETGQRRPERSETKAKLAQVIQIRAKSIVDKYASQLATSDGLTLSYDAATAEQAVAEEEYASAQTAGETGSPAAAPPQSAGTPDKPSKFWGETADFLQPAGIQTSAISSEKAPQSPENGPEQRPRTSGTPPSSSALEGEQPAAAQTAETADNGASPVMDEEIMKLRYRYIVGKTAGEDLNAPDGKRIISRGEVITSDVVALADRYGKLPELIVHMTIPGLGDA
jgi:hypothetical protein